MSSAPSKLHPKQKETISIGLTRNLIAALLRKESEYIVSASLLTDRQLRQLIDLGRAGDPMAARLYSILCGSEAGRARDETISALSYLLDPASLDKKPNPEETPLPPQEVSVYWKPMQLDGPREWEEEMGGGGWRDYTIPLQFEAPPPGARWKKEKDHPLPEKALPNPALVRALSAHRRQRYMPHPDGEDFNMEAMVELAARIPHAIPYAKSFNKPSIPHLVVLVDCSGSMGIIGGGGNGGISQANYASTVVALSAIAARCPFDIIPYEDHAYMDRRVSWRPGQPRPNLPVKFAAGGGNDLMGSTIRAMQELWKAPDRRMRRIVISISDSDIASTCYGYAPRESHRAPTNLTPDLAERLGYSRVSPAEMRKSMETLEKQKAERRIGGDWRLFFAWTDIVRVPMELGAEVHAMFVGHDIKEEWLRGPGAVYVERFKSSVLCPNMKDMNLRMTELATNILQHA